MSGIDRLLLGGRAGSRVVLCIFFVAVFQSLVQDTHPFNAISRFLLCLELKAHFYLLVLLPLVGELVRDVRVLIVSRQYYVWLSGFLLVA